MAQGIWSAWSTTAASNSSADSSINFAEGQAPSSVNDSARALMARTKEYAKDVAGITTGGTATAYTVTTSQGFSTGGLTALDGFTFVIVPHVTSGAAPTIAVDGLAAKPWRLATGAAPPTGAFVAGTPYAVKYSNANNEFVTVGLPAVLPSNYIATANIANSAVTYAKIQNVTTNRLLGNVSGSAAAPSEIEIGAGLVVSSGSLTAPAVPVEGTYKDKTITVASNTTVSVVYNSLVMFDGTNYRKASASVTCNLGSAGAVNQLQSGLTITANNWYYLWAVSNGTTDGVIASDSPTSPTLPSGYTYKAYLGGVRTATGVAQLVGTQQVNKRAQYLVGVAQCANLPIAASGTFGNTSGGLGSIYMSIPIRGSHAPLTATAVHVVACNNGNATVIIVAPNNSYLNGTSTTNPPPMVSIHPNVTVNTNLSGTLLLESTDVYAASTGSSNSLLILGWEEIV